MDNWRARVNNLLASTTGYRLTRAKGPRPAQSTRSAPAKPPANRPDFPVDYEDEYREVIRAVRPFTMTSNDKLHALITATNYIHDFKIPGAIVECGVWRGGSMHAVARTLDARGDHSRDLYLFDTFEGMTEPTEKDSRHDGETAEHLLATSSRKAAVWAYASLEDVQQGFAEVPYDAGRIHYVKGPVEQTIPDQAPEQIALLRLDTDWYESTKHELDHLYHRLVSGGVLLIDDYGWWKGSRTATQEFLKETGARLLLVRMASGRIAVKP
jgi:O-methyltransferase